MHRKLLMTISATWLAGILGFYMPVVHAADSECMSVPEMRARLESEGYVGKMAAKQVFVDEGKRAQWQASLHTFEGQTVNGAQLDIILERITDRDALYDIEQTMLKRPTFYTIVEKRMSELNQYSTSKLQQRIDMISTDRQGFNLYASGTKGLVVTQRQNKACVSAVLQDVVVQHFSVQETPPWLAPSSKLKAAISQYRAKKGYGLAAYGKTAKGDTLAIVARPRFGLGNNDGPVLNLFTGAVLLETVNKEVTLLGELAQTSYTEAHENNFPKRKN